MKKLFSLLAVLLVASVSFAQQQNDPTIASSMVTFAMCTPTASSVTINAQSFPVVWQGESFNQAGTYNRVIENVKGCDSTVTLTIKLDDGSLPGVFSVGPNTTDKIVFSKGVLQYRVKDDQGNTLHHAIQGDPSGTESGIGIFRFAEHQYDYIGGAGRAGTLEGDNCPSDGSTTKQWMDLFGRGTSGCVDAGKNYYTWYIGYNQDYCSSDFSGGNSKFDWGYYNAISNGGNQPGKWFTMSKDQWLYLLNDRTNATQLKMPSWIMDFPLMNYTTETLACYVLLPDNWSGNKSKYTYANDVYQLTMTDVAELEEQGAVFLFHGVYRDKGTLSTPEIFDQPDWGCYWTSTYNSSSSLTPYPVLQVRTNGYGGFDFITNNNASRGFYVRLVKYANQ